jgi:acetolactate synthase I/II/III large subunit
MKVSDFIAYFLKSQGITHVFELSGGMITHMLDSINKVEGINIITVHHEQAAAFAADGYGRAKRIPGIAFATSGPGATNLLTGIASCYFDSSPALFITGQVNTYEQKGDKLVRQLGFQETDIVSMARPVAKAVFQLKSKEEVEEVFYKAFEIAISGRCGPVLIDIPMNIQREEIECSDIRPVKRKKELFDFGNEVLNEIAKDIQASKRPLILAGRGVRSAGIVEQFREFVRMVKVPVVTSLLGVDVIPFGDNLHAGFIGSYGNRWANLSIGEADLLIVLGSRLDIRQTGADINGFIGNKKIIHIDCDESEINNRVKNCIKIIADLEDFFEKSIPLFKRINFSLKAEWMNQIDKLKSDWPDVNELKDIKGINPNFFIHKLSQCSRQAVAYIADVGNHQMWAAQSLEINQDQSFITSGGMGAMGFALPAAIGVTFAENKPVIVIAGDGGFQINIQELQTIVRNQLPVKMIIMNNQSLGMIRQFQDSYFNSRYQSTYWGYNAPDFEEVAKAYKIKAKTISKTEEIESAMDWLWEDPACPQLLQVCIDVFTNVYPKIAFGKPITEMEPYFKPTQMEGT